jgi:transposase
MASIGSCERFRVVGGVDTHKDLHVAAVIDAVGRSLASQSFPATRGTAAHTTQRRVADGLSPLGAVSPSRVGSRPAAELPRCAPDETTTPRRSLGRGGLAAELARWRSVRQLR